MNVSGNIKSPADTQSPTFCSLLVPSLSSPILSPPSPMPKCWNDAINDSTMNAICTNALNRKLVGAAFHTDALKAELGAKDQACSGSNGLTIRMLAEELVPGLQHGVMFSDLSDRVKNLVLYLRGLGWKKTAIILLRMWGVIFNVRVCVCVCVCV